MRALFRLAVALTVALAAAGCQVDGGAVSVRWRIVDLSTGNSYDPRDLRSNDGSCCLDTDTSGRCTERNVWQVHQLGLTLFDPTSGAPALDGERFDCTLGEKTTGFGLPPGVFAIGLQALDTAGDPAAASVPPPEVRTIVRGQIVNLQVVEVGVHPLPLPSPPSMANL